MDYQPKNAVATFVDQYGDEQVIHRPKGRRLSVFKGLNTPAMKLNRAIAVLSGQRIRTRRLELGLSQKQLCQRAGLANVNPKQYIHAIEAATRNNGVRQGTLYALAYALECEPGELLPTKLEAMTLANVEASAFKPIAAL